MTKEEILKSWDKNKIFSKTYFELATLAMQEYADQQTKPLIDEIERLKKINDSAYETCLAKDKLISRLQSRIDELEKANYNYNKLLNMSLKMAKLLNRTLDFNEFMKTNNLPNNPKTN